MKYLMFIVCVFLCTSGFSTAEAASTPEVTFDYKLVPTAYSQIVESTPELSNIPKAKSQAFDDCASVTASYLFEAYNCKDRKLDCKNLTPNMRVSSLWMSSFVNIDEIAIDRELGDYNKIRVRGGGSVLNILINHKKSLEPDARPESCSPYEQFAALYKGNKEFAKLFPPDSPTTQSESHNSIQPTSQATTERAICAKCVLDSLQVEPTKLPEILKAAKNIDAIVWESRFGESICPDWPLNQSPTFGFYPKDYNSSDHSQQKRDKIFEGAVAKIKEVLNGGYPVAVEGICNTRWVATGECKVGHALLITEYQKVCKIDNPSDCRQKARILNTFGQGIQDLYEWVDMDELFRLWKEVKPGILTWATNRDDFIK